MQARMPLIHRISRGHHHRHARAHPEHHAQPLPLGVRIFTWARAIRWVGWGFGEALLPVFILAFSNTYAEAGLITSSVDIAGLLFLPFIGMWADKVSAKKLVLLSMLLYPIVGFGYFFAGVFGMAIFIVIAKVANGLTWELENVGIDTYYRRVISSKHIAASFGYIETWSHVAWIITAVVGLFLVSVFPVHYLLFAIVPFSIAAYLIALRAPADSPKNSESAEAAEKKSFIRSYLGAATEWRTWNFKLWSLSVLVFFTSFVSSLMYFFIPIDAYVSGSNLQMVVCITIFGSLPALFGYKLGKIADARNKYSLIGIGLLGVAAVGLGLAIFPQYWFKLVAMFLMGVILELFYVAQSSLITTLGPEETYGERGSAFEGIISIGDIAAPLILGIGLDVLGFSQVAYVIAGAALLLAVGFGFMKKMRGSFLRKIS
ncbi:MAG: hypothetical protein JWO73_190 [Candidatus Taylorbacteria bacterium]|nr:hypothetical protein [Candidatus Taylorbacteria bacterium]